MEGTCSQEASSSVELSFVIKVYISVKVLSLWSCNQNVYSNKILFFFGLNLYSCLLLQSNFCFLPSINSLVCSVSTLHWCYSVSMFVVSARLRKKESKTQVWSPRVLWTVLEFLVLKYNSLFLGWGGGGLCLKT